MRSAAAAEIDLVDHIAQVRETDFVSGVLALSLKLRNY